MKRNPQATPSSSGLKFIPASGPQVPALHKSLSGAFNSRTAFLLGEDFSSRPVSLEHPLNQILISEREHNNSKNHPLTVSLGGEHKGLANVLRSRTCAPGLESRLLATTLQALENISPSDHEKTSCFCKRAQPPRWPCWQHRATGRGNSRAWLGLLHGILNKDTHKSATVGGLRDACDEEGRGNVRNCPFHVVTEDRNVLLLPDLFGTVEMKTTCAA